MNTEHPAQNRRILIIDDNVGIQEDFRKILSPTKEVASDLNQMEAELFGDEEKAPVATFELDSALQGKEGLALVENAIEEGNPYAMAFIDVRMPPGWDGVETTERIWKVDPELQVVICTAYSDYSWSAMITKIGQSDQLLILKKPFDNVEVLQLAHALTAKWNLIQKAKSRLNELESVVQTRTSELQKVNESLQAEILERAKAEEATQHAWLAAESANRAKSQFLANMSHEIRTPLNGVIGMTELLLDTQLEPQQQEFGEAIRTSADSLLSVISDILDFSKIEAGHLDLEEIDFNLSDVVETSVDIVANRAHAKGIEVINFIQPEVPLGLSGDPNRLRQILTNLLSNGIKFTNEGEVYIATSLASETPEQVSLRFEVRDTGIGISQKLEERLFQPFIQADSSTSRRYGGTGLGLVISRQLVTRMGGEIGVHRNEGPGTTFWVAVPFQKSTEISVEETALPPLTGNILIVDDNASSRAALTRQLSALNLHAVAVSSASEALEKLRDSASQPFHIALLDMTLPETDGLALVKAIQDDNAIPPLALVILSTVCSLPGSSTLHEDGLAACISKPVKFPRLHKALAHILDPTAAADSPRMLAPESAEAATLPLVPANILVAEDNAINRAVALTQLRRLGYDAVVAANGIEVLAAMETADFDIIFMDCQMPEMDGYETTSRIRQNTAGAQPYIVALTASATSEDRELCLSSGMNDYLSKPVKRDTLAAALTRWTTSTQESPS